MAAWGRAIGSSQKIFIYREKEASKPPHNRANERKRPQRQNQTPKSKKPFKNVARDHTPSINLQRKCASQRESHIYIYIYARGGARLLLTLHFSGPYSVSCAITCTCSRTLPYVGSTGELPQMIFCCIFNTFNQFEAFSDVFLYRVS